MSEYISREEAVKALRTNINITISSEYDLTPYEKEINELGRGIYDAQKAAMDSIPSADVRPNIHGHWGRLTRVEGVYSIDGVKTWGIKCQCDKCTFTTIVIEGFGFYDHCPRCGSRNEVEADMREPIGERGNIDQENE